MQFNCNKSQQATAEIEGNFAANQIDIAIVQEPQLADNPTMGCRVKKIPGTMGLQSSNSLNRPGARAAIYIRNDLGKTTKLIVLEQFSSRDIITAQIEILLDDTPIKLLICSLYCPRLDADGNRISDPSTGKLRELMSFANSSSIPIIIGTDANAHNPQWGGDKTDIRGILFEEFCTIEGRLKILNTGNAVTYERLGLNATKSSIDLTLCSESIGNCFSNWKTTEGFRGSDHKPITVEFLATKPAAGRTKVKSSTNWKKFEDITMKNLKSLETVFRKCDSKEGLELAASTFGHILRSAYNITTRSRTINCNFKREWYCNELRDQKKKINRLQGKLQRARSAGDESLIQITLIEYKRERDSYKKMCSKQKFKKWKEMADKLEDIKDTCRLQKILEKKASSNLGTVRKIDGSYTSSIEETQEELMKTHLPGCIRLEDQTPANETRITAEKIAELTRRSTEIHNRHRQSIAATVSTDTESEIQAMLTSGNVKWALDSFKPNKAPGPDGITPYMLKKAGTAVFEPLRLMFESSARLGHIPEEWNAASIIFIPKAGKSTYDVTSAYRPISLMSFVLKTMEKLVDNRLRKINRLDEKLHKNQHAYREGKGTATALDEAATILGNCLGKGGKALAVYLDIKGAFDQTSYSTTTNSLKSLGVKEWTVNWIKCLLSDRKTQPANKDSLRRYKPIMGLPQGGCSSPLGWIACANSLVTRLTAAGFDTIAYADDFKIITKKEKNQIDHLASHIARALRIVKEWCNDTGLSVNPNKIGLMQFYRGKTAVKNINNIEYEGVKLVPTNSFKFLGVHFDVGLKWKTQIQQALEKGRRATMIMAQYLRFSWGPSPKAAMLLMNQVVTPRVMYGCGVWWHKAQLQEHSKKFDKLQRLMLRMATGFFHTTPTADILRIFDYETLTLKAKRLALEESLRLTELGSRVTWEGKCGHRSIDELLIELADARRNNDHIQKTWNTQRKYRVVVNDRQNWQNGLEPDLYTDIWFSDGSKRDDLVGVGICSDHEHTELAFRISGHATIMQAETLGIGLCAEQYADTTTRKKILILSDSQAALKALDNPVIRSATVKDCATKLNTLADRNEVVIGWIPGHSSHEGNERADRLANEGAAKESLDLDVLEATSSRAGKISNWAKAEKKAEWLRNRPDNGLFAKTLIEGAGKGKSKEIITSRRPQIRASVGLLTGHARTAKYLLRAKGEGNGKCRFCAAIDESVEHLVMSCQRLSYIRLNLFDSSTLDIEKLKDVSLTRLVKFSKEAGFYDMLACDMRT